jgi:hypothetical protein
MRLIGCGTGLAAINEPTTVNFGGVFSFVELVLTELLYVRALSEGSQFLRPVCEARCVLCVKDKLR